MRRSTRFPRRWFVTLSAWFGTVFFSLAVASADWTEDQVSKLPASEKAVHLFNGKDFTGWEGQIGKYFTIQDGEIVAKNSAEDAPKASTYLVTKKPYRNFRLIFEAKLVQSEMHSGIALWGKTVEKQGDPYSYMGHLVMFPSGYGYYDLYRRNSIYRDKDGVAKKAGKQHDWNRMEILAIGNRIRHVINGKLVADWSDPKPELCQSGPIGLQLHSNKVAQEVRFRGLVLTENPTEELVTVTADAKTSDASDNKADAIDRRMEDFVEKGRAAGVVTLVAKDGKIAHLGAVGQADIAGKKPMRTDTLFAIASMTKPITATAVMILQDEGKLSVNDPVSKYIPEFRDVALKGGGKVRPITIKDLMTHTSGVVGSQQNEGSLEETAIQMTKRPLGFEPGSKWEYSPGMSICGRVIEVASGQAYDEFLSERIFKPLKMTDTTFHPTPKQQQRIATLYQPGQNGQPFAKASHWLVDFSEAHSPNPSGGLFSTAKDLFRFYQMVLNGGELDGKRILSEQAVRQMTHVQTGEIKTGFTPGNGWGLGWCVVREPQGVTANLSPGTFGHGGAFGTQGWVDPERKMIFVLLIQRTKFGNSDGSNIRAAFQETAVETLAK